MEAHPGAIEVTLEQWRPMLEPWRLKLEPWWLTLELWRLTLEACVAKNRRRHICAVPIRSKCAGYTFAKKKF
jgi:hypothetical protein